jgi:hypothetical protein
MYELKINNYKVGVFKTLREARAYQPDFIDMMEVGGREGATYYRIITKLRKPSSNRLGPKSVKSIEAQNESI